VNTPLRRSGMARVLKRSQFYLHTPHISTNGMNHTCLCLPSRSWYSVTDPEGMEGWVGLITDTPSINAAGQLRQHLKMLLFTLYWNDACSITHFERYNVVNVRQIRFSKRM